MAMQQHPRASALQILSKSSCAMAVLHPRGAAGPAFTSPHQAGSKFRCALDLIVPVKTHVFDDAIAHDDDAAFRAGIGDVLMQRERRDVDIVAARPLEFLRRLGPLPFEGFETIPFQIPVQVVAEPSTTKNNSSHMW